MKRFLPLLFIALFMIVAYLLELHRLISFETLKQQREALTNFVQSYPILAPLTYMGVYALSTSLSIPGGAALSIFGGFLFPQPFSTLYVVVGATIGAIAIFLAAKTALGDTLKKKAGPRLAKMREGFKENAASYLLFLRLVPLFPFWLVNLAPAFFHVPLRTFAWTTFFGIMPGAFAFTQAGVGLGTILDKGEEFSIGAVLNNDVKIALAALGVVALIPVVLKKWRGRGSREGG